MNTAGSITEVSIIEQYYLMPGVRQESENLGILMDLLVNMTLVKKCIASAV